MGNKSRSRRMATPFIALGLAGALLSGCSATGDADAAGQPGTQAEELQISEAWLKAANEGMTSGFAVLENPTDHPVSLVKVGTGLSGSIELHEMEGSGTAMSMKEIDGALEIPAHGTVELAPGGKHLMLMDLKQELKVGESPSLTFTFGDESTLEVPFEIKSYTGANESYAPGHEHADHGGSTESSDHAGH